MTVIHDLEEIGEELVGSLVPRPSGQLAGHAGGLPFEALVDSALKERFPGRAFRHFEALNHALTVELDSNPGDFSPGKYQFGPEPIHYLAKRGKQVTSSWSPVKLFEEKQNDTAENIVFSDQDQLFNSDLVSFVDVKSQNASKTSQPPNIISARKIKEIALMAWEEDLDLPLEILYLGIKFFTEEFEGRKMLRAEECRAIDLFKIDPRAVYINWSAALQIQFHPLEVEQDFNGSAKEWLGGFLESYARSLEHRSNKQILEVTKIKNALEN